jgi:hypothetical protein
MDRECIAPGGRRQEDVSAFRSKCTSAQKPRGSHHQFRHPTRPGRVTVKHPDAEIALGTLRSIFRQAGWDWTARKK